MPVDHKPIRKEKRKYHHKSRNGCSQCKQRHIKVQLVPRPPEKRNMKTTTMYECGSLTLVRSAMRASLAVITVLRRTAPAASWA